MSLLIGAIADDFTGATDIANTFARQGMRVTQILGVPDKSFDTGDAQAIVIALKSRTNPSAEAVRWSLDTLHWLQARGAQQVIFKYCSTFDSTPDGNIGSVYQGQLYVGDTLLSESSMKNHPLTPMRDSNLLRLMGAQSSKKVGLIPHRIVVEGAPAIRIAVDALIERRVSYAVVDAMSNADMLGIGVAAEDHRLITGSSAVATGLVKNFARRSLLNATKTNPVAEFPGRSVVIAGSCSPATRRQIQAVASKWPAFKLDIDALSEGASDSLKIVEWALAQRADSPLLIYASSSPDEVALTQQKFGVAAAGELVEAALGEVASRLVDENFDRIIVAGGETSAAVIAALGV
jgi:uncharacterized protein YgbK (DUF1537 family)